MVFLVAATNDAQPAFKKGESDSLRIQMDRIRERVTFLKTIEETRLNSVTQGQGQT